VQEDASKENATSMASSSDCSSPSLHLAKPNEVGDRDNAPNKISYVKGRTLANAMQGFRRKATKLTESQGAIQVDDDEEPLQALGLTRH
jgi:hypothetical protein